MHIDASLKFCCDWCQRLDDFFYLSMQYSSVKIFVQYVDLLLENEKRNELTFLKVFKGILVLLAVASIVVPHLNS